MDMIATDCPSHQSNMALKLGQVKERLMAMAPDCV